MERNNTSPTVPTTDKQESERKALIERAKQEIPALRETVQKNLSDLRRIAGTGA